MKHPVHLESRLSSTSMPKPAMAVAVLCLASVMPSTAGAQRSERSGQQVVEQTCAACHRTGIQGAPRIGDQKAWALLATRGLFSLSDSAIRGIRKMPSHGGDLKLSDIEIERAITFMVNQSGGRWTEPISGTTPAVERRGVQIVQTQCAKCHRTGLGGAPRIGDRSAWMPRLKRGLDFLVRSAINGHGPMPPRGGMMDLTDSEIRAAITDMFNQGTAPRVPAASRSFRPTVTPNPNRRVVDGTEFYLAIRPAEAIRAQYPPGSKERAMHGGVPEGTDYYYVEVRLFNGQSRTAIKNAQVELTVAERAPSGEKKKLEPVELNELNCYGNYFRMPGKDPYTITVSARNPGSPRPIEATFHYKRD